MYIKMTLKKVFKFRKSTLQAFIYTLWYAITTEVPDIDF